MKSRLKMMLGLLIGVSLLYGVWAAVRAHRDLVTLNVRNMDVRKVVKKIEWQTRESIFVHKDVEGKVTLNVRKVPLEEVLRIIGEQTSSRWSAVYPLYSSGKSLAALKKSLRGEIDPVTHGWTNLQARSFLRGGPMFGGGPMGGGPMGGGPMGGGGRMPFDSAPATQDERVSLQIQYKDVQFATLALGRYAQARVVPEDGTTATVSLKLDQATIPEAVAQLAQKARRNWTKVYTLRGDGRPPEFAMRGPNEGRRGWDRGDLTSERREQFRQQREALDEELKQTLSAEERRRVEEAQEQREQQWQEMQNLSPEQRRERFAQMGGAGRDQRNLDRIKNTTPEQRVERYRRMDQMRQRRQQGSQRSGSR